MFACLPAEEKGYIRTSGTRTGQQGCVNSGRRRDVRHKDRALYGRNILANFIALSNHSKGRKRLATQAAEPCGNRLFGTCLNKYVSGSVLAQNDFMPQGFASFTSPPPQQKNAPPRCGFAFFCCGGGGGIRTPVGLHPNGFQDRLVMTTSIRLRMRQL